MEGMSLLEFIIMMTATIAYFVIIIMMGAGVYKDNNCKK